MSDEDVVVSSEDVEVSYTVAGSNDGQEVPAEPDDFDPASGKLTIRAGESTGTITIRAIDDGVLERVETMEVTLGDVTTGGRPVTKTTATAKTEYRRQWWHGDGGGVGHDGGRGRGGHVHGDTVGRGVNGRGGAVQHGRRHG